MINEKRGQAATETLILISVLFLIILYIISFSTDMMGIISGTHSSSKARSFADDIIDSSTFVYSQGAGARTTIFLEIPVEVENVTLTGNLMEIDLNIKGSEETIYRKTDYILNGSIPIESGSYCLQLISYEGYVEVNRYNASC